jgi:PiT family inorganic phosphate transporter
VGQIAASWVISPVLGGIIAAGFLYLIKRTITYQENIRAAARKVVPLLIAAMAWAFATYLLLKGVKRLWPMGFGSALLIGLGLAVAVYFMVRPVVARRAASLPADKAGVNRLFTVPLIFAAALLSFAHGANDVANAVGPLAAINDAILHGGISGKAAIPLWVMLVGAIGIAIGLALYGPKLIRTVGSEITELDQMRAYCIAMAAALTVIMATQLGLPVSSTHIAVGAVFGVGFLREFLKASYSKMVAEIRAHHQGRNEAEVTAFLNEFRRASVAKKGRMLQALKEHSASADLSKKERKGLKRVYKTELVKRSALLRIVAAWLITVPVSALLAAVIFYTIRGIMLP